MGRDALYPPPIFPKYKKKVIVCGTRTFGIHKWERDLLVEKMDLFTRNFFDVAVVSGTDKHWMVDLKRYVGADYLGEEWAHSKRYTVVRFHPEWEKHGKAAGPIRNREMVEYADYLVAFWNATSKGTKDILSQAKSRGLKVRVVLY